MGEGGLSGSFVDWIILCPPQGLPCGLTMEHILLTEGNFPALPLEIDIGACHSPLSDFFYWNLDCDYPVPTQHYILGVLGEIFLSFGL